jgi:DNA (cytosine-5)-methyltransferase 1
MKTYRPIRALDMFCGAGGSSRGAQMAGAELVASVDMWELAAETYRLNFPNAVVYRMKASSLSPHRVAREVGPIDLLLASPECTNHSVAKGNAPRCEESRATAFQIVRYAKVLRPRWIVVENVVQMRKWERFEEWHRKLRRIGYKTKIKVIDAQDHGAPQSRRRLFVVCDLELEPALPKPRRCAAVSAARILGRGESKRSPWRFSRVNGRGRAAATVERAKRAIGALGKDVPFIMVYYGTDGAGGFQTLARPLRTVTTLDRFALVKPNCCGHEMRMLQPPELAFAMGFPPSHVWPASSRRNRIKLIGNAVCPPVMRDVVKALTGIV